MKKILIIGVLGQDGTLLSSVLPKNEFEIYGICKPNSNKMKINFHLNNFNAKKIVEADFTNFNVVKETLDTINPDIIVNFAGITNVFNAWSETERLIMENCLMPINILNYIKNENPNIFFFQALSSLIYASASGPISELSCHNPMYPYGISKSFVHNSIKEYRKTFDLKCASGIFFNHESQFRGENFIGKVVSKFVAQILKGKEGKLNLGNLNTLRDMSHAEDFMMGVKLIIENEITDDFVFSSNSLIRTKDYVMKFFNNFDLNYQDYVTEDLSKVRTSEPEIYGLNEKLKSIGWKPKHSLDDLAKEMVNHELNGNNIY
jgi:GDPmannose 4,6-dehydratase